MNTGLGGARPGVAVMKRCGLTVIMPLGVMVLLAGCARVPQGGGEGSGVSPVPVTAASEPTSPAPIPSPTPAAQTNYFGEAVNRATSAVVLGQSAQSSADWQLAVGRWQQAVDLMRQVPSGDPNYTQAQAKVQEYQQNLAAAQRRADDQPAVTAAPAPVATPHGLVAQIPIQERRGGTPVVSVTLQGQRGRHSFPMLFDTGATGTLITSAMAEEVGVVIVGSTQAKIADGSIVDLPIGYVDVIEVGGLRKTSMTVAIGGSVGLLGQDVYGEFGIAMGSHVINLHK